MTRVLIAVDDSESSISAARTAHRLFGDSADYVVLNVSTTPMVWGDDSFQYGMVYPVAMPMAGAIGGSPFAIKTAAINHDADVIVIGAHDRSWFSRLVMPSVSSFVLRESNVPVLVAR